MTPPISNDECCQLVGRFLQYWSTLEAELHSALEKALGLSMLQKAIVCSNIQLHDKIAILRACVHVTVLEPKATAYNKTLKDIAEFSANRNMIAHTMFSPTADSMAVRFNVIKARGKLDLPNVLWTRETFAQQNHEILEFNEAIKRITADIGTATLASLLAGWHDAPKSDIAAPGFGGLLSHLLQEPPGSDTDPANPKTDAKTPP